MRSIGDLAIAGLSECGGCSQSPNHPIPKSRHGVTLLEMLIVVVLIGLLAGISFPSVSSGLESLRLASAGDSVASFLSGALNRADRRQEAVEITIDPAQNVVLASSARPGFDRRLGMPDGVRIAAVYPALAGGENEPRRFVVYPGGAAPRISVELVNRKGSRRSVQIDPITGVPQVERIEAK